MALEFEKITNDIHQMAQIALSGRRERQLLLEKALERLKSQADDWSQLNHCLDLAIERASLKKLRAARPLPDDEPLDLALDPPIPPSKATIVASDGSQIAPDRHAPYLYSVINVGLFVYYYGQDRFPEQLTEPSLDFPGREAAADDGPWEGDGSFLDNSALVSLLRDRAEIESLARATWGRRKAAKPLIAFLDQRLLYWPAAGAGENIGRQVLDAWQAAMDAIRGTGALLAGYISRSQKQSVLTTLDALDIEKPHFDLSRLTKRDISLGLTDGALFSLILGPGQRSKIFSDVSQHNSDFQDREPLNEVCFFYLNPGQRGRQVARVDIPRWVAVDPQAVAAVHSLLVDQCRILGDYPYALARADEIAVVSRQDHESLNGLIENAMQRQGIQSAATAKQQAKQLARAGRTRHEM